MRTIVRLVAITSFAWSIFGPAPLAFGQTIEDAVKLDVSPPLGSIQPPARPQGAFFREHVVKKLPLPPEKQAALADIVFQKTAPMRLRHDAESTGSRSGWDCLQLRAAPPAGSGPRSPPR